MENNQLLNEPFTYNEVILAIKQLRNNKSPGRDKILNEFLKNSTESMIQIYVKLFNVILESGEVPTEWAVGRIIPLYKNKGDKTCPDNYRGITLLSCFGKLFTRVLNNRLTEFITENKTIGPEQAGFKKHHSTIDQAFVLKTLIDFYLCKRKRLYCCFIDYKKAFDTVPRFELWQKVLRNGINGKIFEVIKNMYSKAKSCISLNGKTSALFPCNIGVRQGENLSPLLFAIYLSDLESSLANKYHGLSLLSDLAREQFVEEDVFVYLKLYVLLYADDTVIMAESPTDLQHALDAFYQYCNLWKLSINAQKSRVMVFSRGKIRNKPMFNLGGSLLDITDDYSYLGIAFKYNGKFDNAKKVMYDKANRAMFSLISNSRRLNLPVDIQLKLFDALVSPILQYGCEVWSNENCDLLEKVHLRFCKYVLNVNNNTYKNMVYGELGRYPITIQMKLRTAMFWKRLITGDQSKLSAVMYKMIYKLDVDGIYSSPWLKYVRDIFNDSGLSYMWLNQTCTVSDDFFKKQLKLRMYDQFQQTWLSEIHNSPKCINYRMFKDDLKLENYLIKLPTPLCRPLARFRCRNHKLPIELGAHRNVRREMRICTNCNSNDVGDEFHYIFKCHSLLNQRKTFLPKYCWSRPSSQKFHCLMNSTNKDGIFQLAKFIKLVMSLVQ